MPLAYPVSAPLAPGRSGSSEKGGAELVSLLYIILIVVLVLLLLGFFTRGRW
jgi:hypothetical protein